MHCREIATTKKRSNKKRDPIYCIDTNQHCPSSYKASQIRLIMGKGGNAPSAASASKKLLIERDEKISKAPQFYWASGDAMEEPHVERYVLAVGSCFKLWLIR